MILLIGGTKDGRDLAKDILNSNFKVLASTATEYGKDLLGKHPNLTVIYGKKDYNDMIEIIEKYKIKCIVDASHPYAENVSINAIKAAKDKNILYLRYEREKTEISGVIRVKNYNEAAEALKDTTGNIMLTIGSNNLEVFSKLNKNRLFVRVLPLSNVLKKCEMLGFSPNNIIAIQGPFSKEFNKELYRQFDIELIVTKDSGEEGGTRNKIDAAIEEGIKVILIERPEIDYGIIYSEKSKIIEKLDTLCL